MSDFYLSQDPVRFGLKWTEHDPVSQQWRVKNANWTGTYRCELRKRTGELVATPTVTATLDGQDTVFTFTLLLADSASVDHGSYNWEAQEVAGVTRFSGPVRVGKQTEGAS